MIAVIYLVVISEEDDLVFGNLGCWAGHAVPLTRIYDLISQNQIHAKSVKSAPVH